MVGEVLFPGWSFFLQGQVCWGMFAGSDFLAQVVWVTCWIGWVIVWCQPTVLELDLIIGILQITFGCSSLKGSTEVTEGQYPLWMASGRLSLSSSLSRFQYECVPGWQPAYRLKLGFNKKFIGWPS